MSIFHKHYFFVPLNEKGIEELEIGKDSEENVLSLNLTDEEERALRKVFSKFNAAFNIIISIAEEEEITNENLEKAIAIASDFSSISEEPFATALGKLLTALRTAKERGTYLEICM